MGGANGIDIPTFHIKHITGRSAPGSDSHVLHLTCPCCLHPGKVPQGKGALAQQGVALPIQGLDVRISDHAGGLCHLVDIKARERILTCATTARATPLLYKGLCEYCYW